MRSKSSFHGTTCGRQPHALATACPWCAVAFGFFFGLLNRVSGLAMRLRTIGVPADGWSQMYLPFWG